MFRAFKYICVCTIWMTALVSVAMADDPNLNIVDNFNSSAEGWQIYDYNGLPFGTEGGDNVFYPVTWESTGGVGNSGYVWGDESRWRIDTPETPDSILSFIVYRDWPAVNGPNLDLRNAQVSVHLRGDNLDLKGANVYFWAFSPRNDSPAGRWHLTSQPLSITQGAWGPELNFTLTNDENLWTNSWNRPGGGVASLDYVLGSAVSYGFSFVGFPTGQEVTGQFSMDELTITALPEPGGAMTAAGLMVLTIIRRHRGV